MSVPFNLRAVTIPVRNADVRTVQSPYRRQSSTSRATVRFIPKFAKVAQPLHRLTKKDTDFEWDATCQEAFETLKKKLTEAPVLAYPSFDKDFALETDASIQGIGAVLSQQQSDGRLHPVAYASRALSHAESHYSITELKTLAVVWAIDHVLPLPPLRSLGDSLHGSYSRESSA